MNVRVFDVVAPPWLDRAASWLSLLLVVVFFGLPLFRGLELTQFKGDESIYSFAVERMLENGDWLTPRSIPSDTTPFLEKTPLKFWIVAAPIAAGLLPNNEYGHRFWDAAFGMFAFLYVFAIGRLAGGNVCGLVAVFVLFVHRPLIFEHGLRSNNMEAPLLLSYCGGVYHAVLWSRAAGRWQRWVHPLLCAAWFVLGFMSKFVAAAFLPVILVMTAMMFPHWRRRVLDDWRPWLAATALTIAAIVPWFVYQSLQSGSEFWQIILGEHVLVRFTKFLDPAHLKPWHYYFTVLYDELQWSQANLLVPIGAVLLAYQTVRARWDLGALLLLWFIVPFVAMSFGTSKLYHYTYPFLPPIAIAAGLVPAALLDRRRIVRRQVQRLIDWIGGTAVARRVQGAPAAVRWIVIGLALGAFILAILTPILGTIRVAPGGLLLFRNSSTARPVIVGALLLSLAGFSRLIGGVLLVPLVFLALPLKPYRDITAQLTRRETPVRDARDCLLKVQGTSGPLNMQSLTKVPTGWEYWYYWRPLGYHESGELSDATLAKRLLDPERPAPVLLHGSEYAAYLERLRASDPNGEALQRVAGMSRLRFQEGHYVLLPGAAAICGERAAAAVTPHQPQ